MKKVFNKPERAEELKLKIIQAGERSVMKLDLKDIPFGYSVDDILELIKKEEILLVDAPRQDYEYYPLYTMGEVLTDHKGRKIYILDTLDNQYLFKDLDNPESRHYEDFKAIDRFFSLDTDYEFYKKYADINSSLSSVSEQ